MIDIRWNPTRREQLQFTAIWMPAFFIVIAAIAYWRFDSPRGAWIAALAGLLLTAAGLAIPALRRPLYVGFMCASFPIGWTVSHLVLIVVFYLVITPFGIVMRMLGRDPMERRLDSGASTYWTPREQPRDVESWFRQY